MVLRIHTNERESIMGGAIKSVVSSVTSGLGNIGASIIKSVAPKAIDMLKNIVGSGFDSLANVAKGLVSKLPLVGPLASGLIDKLAPGLKNMATNGVESLLSKLANSITERLAPGTNQNVSLPDLVSRLPQILQQTTAAATSAASSAATSSSGSAASIGSGASLNYSSGYSGGMPEVPKDMDKPEVAAAYQQKWQSYQNAMNLVHEMGQKISDLEKSRHDAMQGLIMNLK